MGARLSDVARHVIQPGGIKTSGWPAVRDTCNRLGWGFDPWQDGAGRLILGKRSDGLYAADTIAISIPRQVGKTYLVACIIYALCLLHPKITVIWTAHRKTTAAETFESFDGMAQKPRVAPHVKKVLRGKGDEKILFANGSRILFGARESGFGRGFADVDVLVFDETQIMTDATLEDMAAAQNVAENPLTFMMGTPPRPNDPGEVFTMIRQEAIDGEVDETLYIELSADRDADPMDRDQWRKANPSFPGRTSERAMLRLRKKLKSHDSWMREALGVWDEVSRHQPVVSQLRWDNMVDVGPPDMAVPQALGVDMSPGREISVAACWVEDDSVHVEEVWADADPGEALEWLVLVAGRRVPVLVDAASPARSLADDLKTRRVRVQVTSAFDMSAACGMFENRCRTDTLTHADQPRLSSAVLGGRRRGIRDAGGWGWDRSDPSSQIHPVVAATLSLFGATQNDRPLARRGGARPKRKAVIG